MVLFMEFQSDVFFAITPNYVSHASVNLIKVTQHAAYSGQIGQNIQN